MIINIKELYLQNFEMQIIALWEDTLSAWRCMLIRILKGKEKGCPM